MHTYLAVKQIIQFQTDKQWTAVVTVIQRDKQISLALYELDHPQVAPLSSHYKTTTPKRPHVINFFCASVISDCYVPMINIIPKYFFPA